MRMITTLIVHYNISIYIASGASIVHIIEMVITVGCEMMQYAIIGVHYLGFIFDSHAFHLISEYNNDNSQAHHVCCLLILYDIYNNNYGIPLAVFAPIMVFLCWCRCKGYSL